MSQCDRAVDSLLCSSVSQLLSWSTLVGWLVVCCAPSEGLPASTWASPRLMDNSCIGNKKKIANKFVLDWFPLLRARLLPKVTSIQSIRQPISNTSPSEFAPSIHHFISHLMISTIDQVQFKECRPLKCHLRSFVFSPQRDRYRKIDKSNTTTTITTTIKMKQKKN